MTKLGTQGQCSERRLQVKGLDTPGATSWQVRYPKVGRGRKGGRAEYTGPHNTCAGARTPSD